MAAHPKSKPRRNKSSMATAVKKGDAPVDGAQQRSAGTRPKRPCARCCAGLAKIPPREGLLDTPQRVVDAYTDWFSGYAIDPRDYLRRTFEETAGYDEMVVLRDIEFESHCEHHMAPIIGRAHVGYLPTGKVVGISKLARVVDVFARRFQVQEKMTAEIARCINDVLQPQGVGVVIEAAHECMTTRGIHKRGVSMITSKMLGSFRSDARTRNEFLTFIDIRDRR